jgi:hypothetical protein
MTKIIKPKKPKLQVADILRLHIADYQKSYCLWPEHKKIVSNLTQCRTPYLGGHMERCNHCGAKRITYHSCRNRHCPTCQQIPRERWLEARKKELLPTTYFHVVFTLPHELNPVILNNKPVMLNCLFKAVSKSLLKFSQNELGGKLGFIAVLHTWDQLLKDHFHLHCLVAGGAVSSDENRWIPCNDYLFNQEALSVVFREKFMDHMTRACRCGKLKFNGQFQQLKNKLYAKKWVVSVREPIRRAHHVLEYIARYTHRVAIANSRLLCLKDGMVTFRYKDRKNNTFEKTTITAVEFIRRFLLHALPRGFVRIRHYGFLANRNRKANLSRIRRLLKLPPQSDQIQASVEEMMVKLTGIDITLCPCCNKGKMLLFKEIPKLCENHPKNSIRPPNYRMAASG